MQLRKRLWRRPAKGSVAVEMAIILPIFLLLLAVPLYLARIFWVYSVSEKAAHDAARYLSTATQAEMRTTGGGFNEANVAATARWIAQQELEGVLSFTDVIIIDVQCNGGGCGVTLPATVHVGIQIALHDTLLDGMTSTLLGSSNMTLNSHATFRYIAD